MRENALLLAESQADRAPTEGDRSGGGGACRRMRSRGLSARCCTGYGTKRGNAELNSDNSMAVPTSDTKQESTRTCAAYGQRGRCQTTPEVPYLDSRGQGRGVASQQVLRVQLFPGLCQAHDVTQPHLSTTKTRPSRRRMQKKDNTRTRLYSTATTGKTIRQLMITSRWRTSRALHASAVRLQWR